MYRITAKSGKRYYKSFLILCTISLIWISGAKGELTEDDIIMGPQTVLLGDQAEIFLPEDLSFIAESKAGEAVELTENLPSGLEVGLIFSDEGWFIIFEFADEGYVKDDEKTDLDADAMLKSITESTNENNKELIKRGWSPLYVQGWYQPPRYNSQTHNLQWAVEIKSDTTDGRSSQSINYNTRILGRYGYMMISLVSTMDSIDYRIDRLNSLLESYQFKQGNTYAEYKEGDKLAEYGLSALIVGGGAALASKTGVFKWLWKVLIAVFVAISGFFKKIYNKFKNRGQQP